MTKVADREGATWTRALMRSEGGLVISLTAHDDTTGDDRFEERRVGLDHLSIACEDRGEVEGWERRLTELGVEHGDLVDAGYGHVLTSRDPDGIPVEFFAPAREVVCAGLAAESEHQQPDDHQRDARELVRHQPLVQDQQREDDGDEREHRARGEHDRDEPALRPTERPITPDDVRERGDEREHEPAAVAGSAAAAS